MTSLPLDPEAAALALHVALLDRHTDALRPQDGLDALQMYLDTAGNIRHFTAREVVQLSTHRGVRNRVPTPALWQNIVPTLHVAEWVRSEFGGRPVNVHSGYRSAEYNAAVGGASNSLHRRFNALDISIGGVDPQAIADRLDHHTESHLLGIGVYGWGVHIDVRGLLDYDAPARWDERMPRAA